MKGTMLALILLPVLGAAVGCRQEPAPTHAREFPLTGQVLAASADGTELRVKHDDVKGFMDAMTMDFDVKDPANVPGLRPGDLIAATLVITDEEGYLKDVRKTGTAPLAPRGPAAAPAAALLAPGDAVPDVTLTDDEGNARPLSAYRGQILLVTFIYTRCPLPDYCPRMNRHFGAVQQSLITRPDLGGVVRLLSISFDPDFDTPARLKAAARAAGADPAYWRFATAPRDVVDAFGARFGLNVLREGPDGQTLTHNLRTGLVDRDGRLVKTYNGGDWLPDEVVRDLESLVK